MKKLRLAALFFALGVASSPVNADLVFDFAQVTAQTSGNLRGNPWSGSQFREITTPTAGESQTATITRSITGAFGTGNGTSMSFLTLGLAGFSGTLNQSASVAPAVNLSPNFAAATTSGAAFVEFSLNVPQIFSVAASGQIDGPTSPDTHIIGVQLTLTRNSNGAMPVDYLLEDEGAIVLNQSGILPAGDYSFQAVMTNLFEFDSAIPPGYSSSGNLAFSMTFSAIPEPSAAVLMGVVLGAAGLCIAAARRSGGKSKTKPA